MTDQEHEDYVEYILDWMMITVVDLQDAEDIYHAIIKDL